jgi:hypothetical protein
MGIAKRIFISVPSDQALSDSQKDLKWAIVDKIQSLGYIPEIFHSEKPSAGSLAAGRGWTFDECMTIIKRCLGAIIIGLPRHTVTTNEETLKLPTEYAHFEGAIAINVDLPTMLLAETGLADRGVFYSGAGNLITTFPVDATSQWLSSDKFINALNFFQQKVESRRDIFLGYCSTSQGTARNVKLFIEKVIGATVLDWQIDFIEGRTIIEEIEEAAKRTSGGVFLFTKDDMIAGEDEVAAPRDNVVFETGFFAHAKGRERVLIIREKGAKMPADLGGNIYVNLLDRTDIGPLEARLRRFLETAI